MFRLPIAALVAAFSIVVLPGSFAHAGGLVERTKGLLDKINIFNGKPDPVCDERTPATAVPALQRATAGKITPKPAVAPFKSEGDLRKYLDCYVVEPGRMKIVTEKYLPLIAQAAKDFDIPKTLLACLIFRESRFDINADSGKQPGRRYNTRGAIGLGQHVRSTMADISDTLDSDFGDIPRLEELKSRLSGKPKSEMSIQERKDFEFANSRIELATQVAQWNNYYGNLAKLGLHKGAVPKTVSIATIKQPSIAIGATAFYLQSILVHFKKNLDPTISLEQSDKNDRNYDALLAAAGAYNLGFGAATGILREVRPPNPKKWIEQLKKSNEETAGHILSIENCLHAPASSKAAWNAPMGSHNLDCDSPLDPKPVLPSGINVLPPEYNNPVKSATLTKPKPKAKAKPAAAGKAAATNSGKPTATAAPKTSGAKKKGPKK